MHQKFKLFDIPILKVHRVIQKHAIQYFSQIQNSRKQSPIRFKVYFLILAINSIQNKRIPLFRIPILIQISIQKHNIPQFSSPAFFIHTRTNRPSLQSQNNRACLKTMNRPIRFNHGSAYRNILRFTIFFAQANQKIKLLAPVNSNNQVNLLA